VQCHKKLVSTLTWMCLWMCLSATFSSTTTLHKDVTTCNTEPLWCSAQEAGAYFYADAPVCNVLLNNDITRRRHTRATRNPCGAVPQEAGVYFYVDAPVCNVLLNNDITQRRHHLRHRTLAVQCHKKLVPTFTPMRLSATFSSTTTLHEDVTTCNTEPLWCSATQSWCLLLREAPVCNVFLNNDITRRRHTRATRNPSGAVHKKLVPQKAVPQKACATRS
jgi:cytochrome b